MCHSWLQWNNWSQLNTFPSRFVRLPARLLQQLYFSFNSALQYARIAVCLRGSSLPRSFNQLPPLFPGTVSQGFQLIAR